MGSSNSAFTREQNEAAGAELLVFLEEQGVDPADGVDKAQWEKVFGTLDAKGSGSLSRKDWFTVLGSTLVYDAVPKRHSANLTRAEWSQAFEALDMTQSGRISLQSWLARRQVQVGFFPLSAGLGLPVFNWGVAVDGDVYEVAPPLGLSSTEMAVVGPEGIVALGAFTHKQGGADRWLKARRSAAQAGGTLEDTWLEEQGEPRSRPQIAWQNFEHAGWTVRTDEEIAAWISQWVVEHPSYRAIDAIGRECNDQTFALAFISWLISDKYCRMTDNTKGQVMVYGTLALLAGLGVAYAVKGRGQPATTGKQM